MLHLKINPRRIDPAVLKRAAAVLRRGGVVVFPTETAYGLAVDPSKSAAIAKIFAIKGRPETKALPLIAATPAAVKKAFVITSAMKKLSARWPAPLTLVLPRRRGQRLPALLGRRNGAVRVSTSLWARALAQAGGGLITSTSANLSGTPSNYQAAKIIRDFSHRPIMPDLLLDAGRLKATPPSTIVAWRKGKMTVLRKGPVKL